MTWELVAAVALIFAAGVAVGSWLTADTLREPDEKPPRGLPGRPGDHDASLEGQRLFGFTGTEYVVDGWSSPRQPVRFGMKVIDGGIPGTLIRCSECGGSGELHQPDELPPIVAPGR